MAAAAAVPLIISGISALGSWLSGKNKQTQESTVNDTTTSSPTYDPALLNSRNQMLDFYSNRLQGGDQGFMTGYTGQGMRDINRTSDLKTQALNNILAARGLSSSGVGAGLAAKQEDDRMKQQVDFMSQIPLLARQLQTTDADAFSKYIVSLPTGQTQTRTGTTTGTAYGSNAGAAGSATSNGAAAFLAAMRYFNPTTPQSGGSNNFQNLYGNYGG